MYAPKCSGCGEILEGEVLAMEGQQFHTGCFRCEHCSTPIAPGDSFVIKKGRRACANCRKLICKVGVLGRDVCHRIVSGPFQFLYCLCCSSQGL